MVVGEGKAATLTVNPLRFLVCGPDTRIIRTVVSLDKVHRRIKLSRA